MTVIAKRQARLTVHEVPVQRWAWKVQGGAPTAYTVQYIITEVFDFYVTHTHVSSHPSLHMQGTRL